MILHSLSVNGMRPQQDELVEATSSKDNDKSTAMVVDTVSAFSACGPPAKPPGANATILIATPVKNSASALGPFAQMLRRLNYPKNQISVAFLVSDSTDGTLEIAKRLEDGALADFANVQVIAEDFHYAPPQDRHSLAVQPQRRAVLAKSRNSLLRQALTKDIFGVLWLDIDIVDVPSTFIEDMIQTGQPVVAPGVYIGESPFIYDRNSWRETLPNLAYASAPFANVGSGLTPATVVDQDGGTSPSLVTASVGPYDFAQRVDIEGFPDAAAPGRRVYLDDLRQAAESLGENNPLFGVKLDGVGTAALFVRADVHRDHGVLFPEAPYKHRLESEGFGLLAEDKGFQPCGLPLYKVKHFDEFKTDTFAQAWNGLQGFANRIASAFPNVVNVFRHTPGTPPEASSTTRPRATAAAALDA